LFNTDVILNRGNARRLEEVELNQAELILQRAHRLVNIFAALASKQTFFLQEARIDREVPV